MKIKVTKYDRLTSKVCKLRDGGCLICKLGFWIRKEYKVPEGSRKLESAHIQPRWKMCTRYYPPNVLTLCFNHHQWFDSHKGIRDDFMVEAGLKTAKELVYLAIKAEGTWDKDLFRIEIDLKDQLREFEMK